MVIPMSWDDLLKQAENLASLKSDPVEELVRVLRKYVELLKKELPDLTKIYIYVDTTSYDCPSFLYMLGDEETDVFDIWKRNSDLAEKMENIEENLCVFIKRHQHELSEGVIIEKPVHIIMEIL